MAEVGVGTLLAGAVAFLGVCVAWGQWYTARQRLILDLFEKRHAQIQAIRNLALSLDTTEGPSGEFITRFYDEVVRVHHLFGDEIVRHCGAMRDLLNDARYHAQTSKHHEREGRAELGREHAHKYTHAIVEFGRRALELDFLVYPYMRMNQRLPLTPRQWLLNAWLNRPDGTEAR